MDEQEPRIRPNGLPEDTRPFVAPCRHIEPLAPLRWLKKGWQDFRAAPVPSLVYGLVMVAMLSLPRPGGSATWGCTWR